LRYVGKHTERKPEKGLKEVKLPLNHEKVMIPLKLMSSYDDTYNEKRLTPVCYGPDRFELVKE